MRQIAAHADVSVGLLYRYFPSKRAVVLNLYDRLSLQFEMDARAIEPGPWRQRFVAHMRASLAVLAPHRAVLSALVPILVDGHDEGLFSPTTAMSRDRVQSAFVVAVVGATDTPPRADAEALGRSLYLVHLAVVLWWLLDRSPQQRATKKLVALIGGALPMGALALRLPPVRALVRNLDALIADALMPPTAPKAGASDA